MVDGNKQWKGWLYLSPALLLLLVFTVWPIFNTVRMAFSNGYEMAKELNGTVFSIGFENFEKVIKFPLFLDCLKTTAILCVVTVPLSTLLALFIAVCLNSIKPLSKLYQTVFFLPYVTNSIAIGISTSFLQVKPGKKSKEEILEKINNGIQITNVQGLHSGMNPLSGDFSLQASGYRIENGKITTPVNLITIAGNLFEVFKDIDEVGNDLHLSYSGILTPSVSVKKLAISGK